jgi:glycosyltransferase involved in cell wall biosynthesis
MKIVFILPSLKGGGAERVILTLANGFKKRGNDVYLLLINDEIDYSEEILDGVKIVNLGSKRVLFSFFGIRRFLNEERPDIVFSTIAHLNVYVLLIKAMLPKNRLKYVIRESNTLSEVLKIHNSIKNKLLHLMIKIQYPKADLIIAPSRGVADDLINNYNINKDLINVIYNPIDYKTLLKSAEEPFVNIDLDIGQTKTIIGIGSLSKQKDFSTLIKAFYRVEKSYDCKLIILGEGQERENLESLIKELDLQNRIFMPGFDKNPFKYLKNADIFILSSIYEGLPNVLIQALLLGVPCIATNCKSGPDEILKYGDYGQLVEPENPIQISDAIENIFSQRWSVNFDKKLHLKYDVDEIINRYLDISIFKTCPSNLD